MQAATKRDIPVRFAFLGSSKFRKKALLYGVAFLSFFDVASDVFSISENFVAGRTEIAYALLSTILLSFALQLALAVTVHRHQGSQVVAQEMCFVLCGCKPFVDARRIIRGVKIVGAPVDAKVERLSAEVFELTVEAIPAAIIQIVGVLGGAKPGLATVISIAFSFVAIAVVSASIFFSKDTDDHLQLINPAFYGAAPESPVRRSITMLSLFVLQLAHAVCKLGCISLLYRTSWKALAAYLSGGMAVFLGYKLARRDFWYWARGLGLHGSIVARVVVKLLVDCTGNPHFRSEPGHRPPPRALTAAGAHRCGRTAAAVSTSCIVTGQVMAI